jgi:hypothetical protein
MKHKPFAARDTRVLMSSGAENTVHVSDDNPSVVSAELLNGRSCNLDRYATRIARLSCEPKSPATLRMRQ